MADTKISALTASTTPLAGTEVLPIVQSGVTKQVSVANLTAGRVISANGLTFPAIAAASSDPNTLDDYEEGTWTPTDASSAGLTFTAASGRYVKIGRYVFCAGSITYPVTASAAEAIWGGLPFNSTDFGGGTTTYCEGAFQLFIRSYGGAVMGLVKNSNATAPNVQLSGASIAFTYAYQV